MKGVVAIAGAGPLLLPPLDRLLHGVPGLDRGKREALVNDYYTSGGAPAVALGRVILGAYYRDDRVLLALKLEARPPFPQGYTLEQGDWSLLDAVRRRPPFWRDDRPSAAGKR